MTGMAEKLQQAGYRTAQAGKWDAGMATPAHTPHGRGYNTSLNYFSHKNDFWSQANMQTCCDDDQTIIDFWHTDRGASDVNGTDYSEFLYMRELVNVVVNHDASQPLMMFYAPHVAHCPLQVPKFYYDKFSWMSDDEGKCAAQTVKGVHTIDPHHPELEYKCRQQYKAMVSIMDEVVGNVTDAMKNKSMWDNTLVVFSSDNGGPVDLQENAANNWPLRGGKYSLFEGGLRVAAFVSGGFIPKALRGTTNNGIVHIADWYATLSSLAGVDPTDHRAAADPQGLPPIDSIDMWPFLSGKAATSPRTTIPVGNTCLVKGDYKIILGSTSPDFWQGPKYPNSSSALLHTTEMPPPRPFASLQPCYTGPNSKVAAAQMWTAPPTTTPGTICSLDPVHAGAPCWNIQGNQPAVLKNIILWAKAGSSNEDFQIIEDGALKAPEFSGDCIGAPSDGGGLHLYSHCPAGIVTKGFAYNATSKQVIRSWVRIQHTSKQVIRSWFRIQHTSKQRAAAPCYILMAW